MGGFGGGLETIAIEFDPRSILAGIQRVNQDLDGLEGKTSGTTNKLKTDWQGVADLLTRVADKSKNSADSYIRSLERQAAAVGKSGLDKLNSQMEQAIKNYGYSEAAIKKITAAYEKMADAQEKGAQGFSAGQRAGMGARDLFEGRNAYAAVEFSKGLSELRGAPAVIGAVTAAFGAAALAGYELVKSTSEEARELNNLAIRTGLSVEQAENLSIQAKIAGVEITSLERSAIQLSKGLEDASGAGKKQVETLRDLGINTLQATGQQKEMGEVLSEVLQKLSQIPDTSKRLYEAQLLLGRGAKELQPMIADLATLKETADQLSQSLASGANEELLKAARQISTMDEAWSVFKKNLASKIAPVVIPVVTYVSNHLSGNPQNDAANAGSVNSMTPRGYATAGRELGISGLSYAPSSSVTNGLVAGIQGDVQGSVAAEAFRQSALQSIGNTPESLQAQIADKKQQVERDLATLNQKGAQDTKVYTDAKNDYNKALKAQLALELQLKALQAEPGFGNALEGYSLKGDQGLVKQLEDNRHAADELRKQYPGHTESINAQEYSNIDAILKEFTDKALIAMQKVSEKAAEEQTKMLEERLSIENSITQQGMKNLAESSKAGVFSTGIAGEGVQIPLPAGIGTPPGPSSRQQAEITKDMLAQESRRIELVAGPGGELAAARQIIDLKKQALAIDEQQAESEAQSITSQVDREKKIYDIRLEYARQVYDAESQYQDKLLEKQKQLAELTAGLYHTLLTNPSKFPKQLASTVKESALKPVTEGLGNITAGFLAPIFYGSGGGKSGLSDVRSTNGALHVFVTNPAGGGTASLPYFGASAPLFGGGTSDSGGFAPGFIGLPGSVFSGTSDVFGGGSGFSGTGGGYQGGFGGFSGGGRGSNPLGTALSVAKWASMVGGSSSLSTGSGIFGPTSNGIAIIPGVTDGTSSGSSAAGSGSSIGNQFKGFAKNISNVFSADTASTIGGNFKAYGDPAGYQGGTLANLSASPAAGTPLSGLATSGGTALALHGLTGNDAGTWGGTAQGAAGGFLIAGPIGAAVGAAIGFGEQLAGVESDRRLVIGLVKQMYHLTISNKEADTIVQIAKTKYGDNKKVAVQSPEVRQMLGVYAAGTGQGLNSVLSATTPRAGSLVEQGGTLFQQATYQYGQPYSYQSNLPVLGGPVAGNYPSPGAQTVQLNINGQSAADLLEGRIASTVTPSYVSSQFSQANQSSDGRLQSSADLSQPGLIVS